MASTSRTGMYSGEWSTCPRVPAEQLMVALAVDAVGKAQLPQRLHDAALIEHAAVPGVFQRLLGTELGKDGFQLPGALQAALVAALAHDIAVAAQGLALGVGPVGQQVDPVLALVIVAGELGAGMSFTPSCTGWS